MKSITSNVLWLLFFYFFIISYKGAYRWNCAFHPRHLDVFNSTGQAYENAWDLPPAAETVVAVPQAVEEEGRDDSAGVLRYLNSELFI